jgi:hypothetical protein
MEGTKYRTSRQQQHHLLPKQMRRIRNLLILVVVAASFLLPNEYFRYANILLANASLSNGICDLECPTNIGSKCAFGESPNMIIMNSNTTATSSSTTTKSINGMHCICPEFYTGIQCEFSFDSCNDKNQHVCYHGGTCQSGGVDQYGNIQHYCDCSNAKDTVTKSPYVGKYCELATVATCDDPIEPNLFCFNGGICNDKFPYVFWVGCCCSCWSNSSFDVTEYLTLSSLFHNILLTSNVPTSHNIVIMGSPAYAPGVILVPVVNIPTVIMLPPSMKMGLLSKPTVLNNNVPSPVPMGEFVFLGNARPQIKPMSTCIG